jgi:phosphoribosylanthranilate isomerase
MTWIKVCGITNLTDALKVAELGADALGFIFYEKSPRKILKEQAKEIITKLRQAGPKIRTVGVFVDEPEEKVKEVLSCCHFDILQFHGDETPAYCKNFPLEVIKAFRIKDRQDLVNIPQYEVDYYLLDTYNKELPGGTGETFNWDLAKEAQGFGKPILLSGGLNPENIRGALEQVVPFGVDVASGVETSPGKKDHKKLEEFINKVRGFHEAERKSS